jgi:hypothetical protein
MKKEVIGDIGFALGIVALALVATAFRKAGYIDHDSATRLVIGANGLMIAYFGNRIPKAFVPSARARQIKRVAGWSLVLSGLVYAALFAFAPIPLACWGGAGAVFTGIAITIGYGLSLRNKARAA